MDLNGNLMSLSYSFNGKPLISLELNRTADTKNLHKLEIGETLKIKLSKHTGRTNEQNNLMWAIITEICFAENKKVTQELCWEIYTYGIESAGVEYEDYEVKREAIKIMQRGCRASRIIEEYEDTVIIRCFTGSSRFNKKEMGELIDWFLDYAAKSNIPIIDYRAQYLEIYG